MDTVNVHAKFEVHSFTRSWDNRRYSKNLGSPWIHPRSLLSHIFSWAFVGMDPVNVSAKFAVRSFTRSSDNSDCSFGMGCKPPILGKGGRKGSGMVPFKRALASSYRHSIVTFIYLYAFQILQSQCRACTTVHRTVKMESRVQWNEMY